MLALDDYRAAADFLTAIPYLYPVIPDLYPVIPAKAGIQQAGAVGSPGSAGVSLAEPR